MYVVPQSIKRFLGGLSSRTVAPLHCSILTQYFIGAHCIQMYNPRLPFCLTL